MEAIVPICYLQMLWWLSVEWSLQGFEPYCALAHNKLIFLGREGCATLQGTDDCGDTFAVYEEAPQNLPRDSSVLKCHTLISSNMKLESPACFFCLLLVDKPKEQIIYNTCKNSISPLYSY